MLLIFWFVFVALTGFFWSLSLLDKSQFTDNYTGYDSLYLNAFIGDFYIVFFYLLAKLYTGHMRLISNKSIVSRSYERVIFPLMAIFFPSLFENYSINNAMNNGYYFISVIFLFALLFDPLNNIHKYYIDTGIYKRNNESYLYLKFPPEKNIDLLPFFILIHGLYIFIAII